MDDEYLKKIYYDPKNPAAFSTLEKLYEATDKTISRSKIKEWLQKQNTYTLHKPKRKRFTRNFYDVDNIGDLWQADLICWESLASYNDGFKYILVVIDVFSKFAFTVPMRSKNSSEVLSAFEKIFNSDVRPPLRLQTDKGREFNNSKFIKYMQKHSVLYDVVQDDQNKSCVAERLIRTLKGLIYKYLTSVNSLRYVDVLHHLTSSYNNRKHSSIGMQPSQVNDSNILIVWKNLNKKRRHIDNKTKHKEGDHVRVSKNEHIFSKGFTPNWSEEVFIIKQVILRNPVVYRLIDLANEDIKGVFYEKEIQKIIFDENTSYLIDKIIKTKTKSGRKLAFVSWRGWPEKFNSWIDYKLIKKFKNG
jgi:Integrase core domain